MSATSWSSSTSDEIPFVLLKVFSQRDVRLYAKAVSESLVFSTFSLMPEYFYMECEMGCEKPFEQSE